MKYFYKVDKDGNYVGFTTMPEEGVILTTTPMKPINVEDKVKYNFDTNEWEYFFKKENQPMAETPYMWVDHMFTSMYSGKIFPHCGDLVLPKSKAISILIPCYGKAKYIIDCVKSCLAQSMLPKEIIILLMDDESIAMKEEISNLDKCIKCIIHDRLNAAAARTKLVNLCSTDWFILLDADDMLKENFIEECYKNDASLIFPRVQHIDEEGDFIGKDEFDVTPASNGFPIACIINNLTCLMHKDVFNDIGLDEDLAFGGEDFDFFIRAMAQQKYKITMADKTCYYYRHTNGLVNSHRFYEPHAKAIAKNIEYLHSEYVALNGYHAFEDTFYHNPTLKGMSKLSNYDPTKLIIEKDNIIRYKFRESKKRTPMDEFSIEQFSFINVDDCYKDEFLYILQTFDVLFTEPLTYHNIFNENIGMIINNKILEDKNYQNLKDYDRLIYLLDNYACFSTGITKEFINEDEVISKIRKTAEHNDIIKQQLDIMDSPVEELDFSNDSRMVTAVLVLHDKCNMKCEYCNQWEFDHEQTLTDDEIYNNFDIALSMLENKFEKLGWTIEPGIIGGEPTLWSDYLVQKILDRTKKFRKIKLYSNGSHKESLWYKADNVIIVRHVLDWDKHPEHLTRQYLEKNEIPIIVVTKEQVDLAEKILPQYKNKLDQLIISICTYAEDPSKFDCGVDEVYRLNKLARDNGTMLIPNTCDVVKTMWINCNNFDALGCCRFKNITTIENAIEDFLHTTPELCASCVLYGTEGCEFGEEEN